MSPYAHPAALQHEPARSYDLGTWLWGMGCSVTGPTMMEIGVIATDHNRSTAILGFNRINKKFDDELINFKPSTPSEFVFTNTQTGRIPCP